MGFCGLCDIITCDIKNVFPFVEGGTPKCQPSGTMLPETSLNSGQHFYNVAYIYISVDLLGTKAAMTCCDLL